MKKSKIISGIAAATCLCAGLILFNTSDQNRVTEPNKSGKTAPLHEKAALTSEPPAAEVQPDGADRLFPSPIKAPTVNVIDEEDHNVMDSLPAEPSDDNIDIAPMDRHADEILAGEQPAADMEETYDEDGNEVIQPTAENVIAMPAEEYLEEIMANQNSREQLAESDSSADDIKAIEPSVGNMNQMPTGEFADQIMAGQVGE